LFETTMDGCLKALQLCFKSAADEGQAYSQVNTEDAPLELPGDDDNWDDDAFDDDDIEETWRSPDAHNLDDDDALTPDRIRTADDTDGGMQSNATQVASRAIASVAVTPLAPAPAPLPLPVSASATASSTSKQKTPPPPVPEPDFFGAVGLESKVDVEVRHGRTTAVEQALASGAGAGNAMFALDDADDGVGVGWGDGDELGALDLDLE
jgi:hypothetical protein